MRAHLKDGQVATKFHGSACSVCGGTERWSVNSTCIVCERRRSRERHAKGYRRTNTWAKEHHRDWYLRKNYGIGEAEYAAMLAKQGGKCAICGDHPNPDKALCVDHCHATGAVRALLCDPCNTSLGKLKDNPALFRAAADYIEKHAAIAARQDHGGATQTS